MQLVKDVKTKNRKLLCFCIYLMFQINCTFKSLSVTIQNPTWRHSGNKETAVSIKNNPMTNFKCAESNLITELKEVCRKIIFPWKDIMYKVPCCGSSLPLPPPKRLNDQRKTRELVHVWKRTQPLEALSRACSRSGCMISRRYFVATEEA